MALEGVDNVGKSAVSRRLGEALSAAGFSCHRASFPGRTPGTLAAHVYRLYHSPSRFGVKRVGPEVMQMLLTGAHLDVIAGEVLPALSAGKFVILDRFWWSTAAYAKSEGVRPAVLTRLLEIEGVAWGRVAPLAVFLLRRRAALGSPASRKIRRIAAGYERLAREEARRGTYDVHIIDNDATVEDAVRRVLCGLAMAGAGGGRRPGGPQRSRRSAR